MSRFSQLYLERGAPARDSARFRNRLAAFFSENLREEYRHKFRQAFERETGAKVPWAAGGWDCGAVFTDGELRDVLDAITIMYRLLEADHSPRSRQWLGFVDRVMREENLGYRVDDSAVVHFHVDELFERGRGSAMAVLDAPHFGAVRAALAQAYSDLDGDPPDTIGTARNVFEAAETLSKLIVPDGPRLTRNLCVQKLKDACIAVSGGDAVEREVLGNLFTSFGYWVEAVHDYRHGQREHARPAPTPETAVLILAEGTNYIRQLAHYAGRMQLPALGNRVQHR